MTLNAHIIALEAAAKAIYEMPYDGRNDDDFPYGEARAQACAAITAYLAALDPHGLKVTPREPTEGMKEHGAKKTTTIQIGRQAMSGQIGEWAARDAYTAMHDSFSWPRSDLRLHKRKKSHDKRRDCQY